MKKIILFISFLIITTGNDNLKAWDTTAAKYYPINTGNVYVFEKYDLWFSCLPHELQSRYYVRITNNTIKPNGKNYYKFSGWWNISAIGSPSWTYQRIDSASMNVYAYDSVTNGEFLLDSLTSNVNNHFKCARLNYIQPSGWYERIDQMTIFNSTRMRKQFQCSGPVLGGTYYYLVEGVGFTGYSICELESGVEYILKGCVINGTVYGDTSLTSVSQSENSVPAKYSLSQNYPNPFNPITHLEFGISDLGFVSLKVYNVLGNEVKTLVNENKPAGYYEVEFDGSDLPSGVYYYKLEAGSFSEVRKMILLK